MDPLPLVMLIASAVAGGAVQSALGFGAAFTLVPVLAVVAPDALPGAALTALLPLTSVMALREVASMDRGAARRLSIARLPGIAAGTLAVVVLPERGLAAVVAGVLLAAVVATAVGVTVRVTNMSERLAGLVSGFSGTTVGLGGPPLAILYRGRHSSEIRPTLAVVFAVGILLSLGALALAGEFGADDARIGALLAGANVVGLVVAAPLVRRLSEPWLRAALLWWAGAGAILAIARVVLG